MDQVLDRSRQGLLYEQVAARVEGLIAAGTLRVGSRIPSVRKLASQWDVSIATVLAAYRTLEDRGLIEARPQSGYYVRAHPRPPCREPEITRPPARPTNVTVADLVMRMLRAQLDPDVVPLGAAVPGPQCLPTQQLNRLAASAARRVRRGSNVYDVPPGNRELRVQVARRYVEAGCALSPDEIVTTCGSQEAIGLCLRAVTRPGDTVAIESPTYYGILQTIEVLGLRALEIPTHPRDGLSVDALRLALDEREVKAVVLVSNYNNPLGCRVPDARQKELVELLAERRVPLIEDDVYGDCGFEDRRPGVCKAHDRDGRVLLCSSFSKTLAPGYRVGWVAPGRWKEEVERLKFVTTLATPTVAQIAIADFLASGGYEHHLRRVRRMYVAQVRQVSALVQQHFPDGTRLTRPAGGSVLWVEMPEGVDALELHDRALARKVSIAPGPMFSAKGRYRNCIRLSCGYPVDAAIERGIRIVGELARSMA